MVESIQIDVSVSLTDILAAYHSGGVVKLETTTADGETVRVDFDLERPLGELLERVESEHTDGDISEWDVSDDVISFTE